MKNRFVAATLFLLACAVTCTVLVTAGYYYLDRRIQTTGQETPGIPYEFALPENRSILLEIGESKLALYLDFENDTLYLADARVQDAAPTYPFDNTFDYTIRSDLSLLCDLVDTLGGITLSVGGETWRYTGSQVLEMMKEGITPDPVAGNTVKEALIRKIAQQGLRLEDLQRILEQSDTNLNIPDCALWEEHLPSLFANAVFQ